MDWLKTAFEAFGAKAPIASYFVVGALCALGGMALWHVGAIQHYKAEAAKKSEQPGTLPAPTIEQKGEGPCSNVVAGRDANINCTPPAEKTEPPDNEKPAQ